MKVALCVIGRLENQYALEFVEYYKSIGFDKIFIYDNNFGNEEHFEDVLQTYIDDDFVEITNYRDKEISQLSAYTDCYNLHKDKYDWIAFFDFDEFLYIVDGCSVKEYLSDKKFDDFQCIHINWMMYDDNDLVNYESKPLLERFKRPMEINKCVYYDFPENNHIKSIVKGGINNFKWIGNPHSPNIGLACCNNVGIKCKDVAFNQYNFEKCYLKHFYTKTIEEFFTIKEKRQRPDRPYKHQINYNDCIKRFFSVNEKTEEKIKFLEKIGIIDNKNDIDIFICSHKDFKNVVNNSVYKIIDARKIDKSEYKLEDDFYSEFLQFFYVNKHIELKEYVGFCHYRRYFSFMDDIPDMEEIFKDYDVIVAKPIVYKISVKEQYGLCHNIEDLYIIGGILADKYPQYCEAWHKFLNDNIFFPYNMFVMKKEDFKEYITFIHDVLDEYLNVVGTDIIKRIGNNVEKYLKKQYPNSTIDYQYRIGGYLAERLTNLFILTHFKKMKSYPVKITEEKYTK